MAASARHSDLGSRLITLFTDMVLDSVYGSLLLAVLVLSLWCFQVCLLLAAINRTTGTRVTPVHRY